MAAECRARKRIQFMLGNYGYTYCRVAKGVQHSHHDDGEGITWRSVAPERKPEGRASEAFDFATPEGEVGHA